MEDPTTSYRPVRPVGDDYGQGLIESGTVSSSHFTQPSGSSPFGAKPPGSMTIGNSMSSGFPSSSASFQPTQRMPVGLQSSGYSSNSGGDYSWADNAVVRALPYSAREFIARPSFKYFVIGVFTILLIIIIAVAASSHKSGGGGSGSGGKMQHGPRSQYLQMDCTDVPDLLFGTEPVEHNGHYYQLVGGGNFAMITWFDALRDATHRCHNGVAGYLAAVQSKEENDFLLQLVKGDFSHFNQNANDVWLGGADFAEGKFEWFTANEKTDGKVFWTGGSPVAGGMPVTNVFNYFENPGNGASTGAKEPNSNGDEDCVMLRGGKHQQIAAGTTDGMWNDNACYARVQYFIVEFDK